MIWRSSLSAWFALPGGVAPARRPGDHAAGLTGQGNGATRPSIGEKTVKLVLFQDRDGGEIRPGLLTIRGVVDIAGAIRGPAGRTPADTMNGIVDGFEAMREDLARLCASRARRQYEDCRAWTGSHILLFVRAEPRRYRGLTA